MFTRVLIDEIPKKKRWNLHAVWEGERERIEEFIASEANEAFGRNPNNPEGAKKFATNIWNRIAATFPQDAQIDPRLLEDARTGRLQEAAGSDVAISSLFWLSRFAFGLELAVFAAMWFFGESSPVILVHGGLLAISAFALGWGLGHLFIAQADESASSGKDRFRTYAALTGGIIGVGVMTALRVRSQEDSGFAVVAVTLILALVISLFEALYLSLKFRYDGRHNDMYRAQVLFANAQHNLAHSEDGKRWREQFESRIVFLSGFVPPMLRDDGGNPGVAAESNSPQASASSSAPVHSAAPGAADVKPTEAQ